jgi:Trp operon repressor
VYPQVVQTFENEEALFAPYYGLYSERIRESRVQPFFNSVETPAQRSAFIDRLRVTHVLVDPAYYREMRQVLDQLPGQYALRFSEAEWAVYEVLRPRPGV